MLSAEQLYKLVSVADPRVNKRGQVAYTLTQIDKKKDAYATSVWILRGRASTRVVSPNGSISSISWSPSGKSLAFVRTTKEAGKARSSILVIKNLVGEPQELFHEEGVKVISLKWVDENSLCFIKDVVLKSKSDSKTITKIRFRLDSEGYFHDRWKHLFVLKIGSKKPLQLTKGEFDVTSFDVEPKQRRVFFASNLEKDAETSIAKKIYSVPLTGGEPKKVVDWEGTINNLSVSPDGSRIAFLGHEISKGLAANTRLNIASVTSGSVETIDTGLDRSLENSLNSDVRARGTSLSPLWKDERIFFEFTDKSVNRLAYYSLKHSETKIIQTGELSVEGYDVLQDEIYFTAMSYDHPPDLFKISNGKLSRLTSFAKKSAKNINPTKPIKTSFIASDGVEIEGWFIPAKGQAKGTVLEIHGGPKTAYGEVLMFEFHFLSARGFNVIYCNPRGSSGYGERFAKEVVGHYGERDYMDLMEFVEHCVKKFALDKSRLYVTGGSYGGFMTNWIVGHTDLFKAAVTQRSISNWISFYGTSDIGYYFTLDQIGARPWGDLQTLWDKSPLKYVERIRTPLLIHHAEQDYRCPIEQAEQLFTALRELGREVVFVSVPEESHELSRSGKPSRRVERLKQIVEWFEKH
ncbi:hypothetical protein B9Q01_02000 [Candidatus Marsarchaeota G1 archaeon OSP_D]|jgi:dipeptidyl aminopeptidase/acylaminoacyl peptidase|uniref:Peptidase S9 prolyl oligopeptidase catalytic domain-containing protein n=3 Tax=Candidatus Marsarchaeota group 1 TaxID=2203770 RepID=A0A2R6AJR6_9ARCH|nr:MAG: hypothetical protein B9Q01_02000 [Candidatus Marsarchaeota G1 archaeon OSP_D]PSN86619.1 MAG: hypothetical protein B9Q02_01260 [Candidatus Marsarchaeota G1 archaeon BE_D]